MDASESLPRYFSYRRIMVITPTVTETGTYVLWIAQNGQDVGSYAIGVLSGIEVLLFFVSIVLGLTLAIKILP